jgi:hypothetical protein
MIWAQQPLLFFPHSARGGTQTLGRGNMSLIGLYNTLDGITNLKYKLLCFLTPNQKKTKRKVLAFNKD